MNKKYIIKLIVFFISIFPFLSNCQVGNKTEQELYSCLINSYKNQNINYEQGLVLIENILIKNNILENKLSKAYYKFYIQIQNIIVAAINELRNEFALQFFEKDFNDLNEEQQKAIKIKYPFNLSEYEPK